MGREVSAQPPWSMAMSTKTLPGFIWRSIAREMSFGAFAPGTSTAPMSRSTVGRSSDKMRLAGIERVRRTHGDVEKAHPLHVDFEDGHVRAEAGRHARGVDARGAAAEHDDFARQHARHAAEQDALAAVGLGQKMAADDDRHAPRDFAHRFEQRQAVIARDRFVGDGGHARFQQRVGQFAVRGEMEIGEKNLALAQKARIRSRPAP